MEKAIIKNEKGPKAANFKFFKKSEVKNEHGKFEEVLKPNLWYVLFQDEGQDMSLSEFKEKN